MDADAWRHILASKGYGTASEDLRNAFASLLKSLCTDKVSVIEDHGSQRSSLEAFLACRLIPLDKQPGLRPIGVGEVLRRLAGKIVISISNPDIQEAVGYLLVCAGQPGGCLAAIFMLCAQFMKMIALTLYF